MQLKLGLGFALLALSINGFAQGSDRGGHDGGGGQGVVCYNKENQIESVELLDLFEGRILEGLNIVEDHSSAALEQLLALHQKNQWYFNTFSSEESLKEFTKVFRLLPAGTRLKPIADSNSIFIPSNCKIEQLVNFQGPSRIFVVSDFWHMLSPTAQAALYAHELIWSYERNNGALYSSRARRTVARLFADNYDFLKPTARPKNALECSSWDPQIMSLKHSFWIDPADKCTFNFAVINGELSYRNHTGSYMPDMCEDIFKILSSPRMPDVVFSKIDFPLFIREEGASVNSHILNFSWVNDGSGVITASTKNLEFPGFNFKNENIQCYSTIE